jgi:23S rRNA (adenine2503-C2)-methyltransferase
MPHILDRASRQWPKLPGDRERLLMKGLFRRHKKLDELLPELGQRSCALLEEYTGETLLQKKLYGKTGDTQKLFLETKEGHALETVWLPEGHKNSICLSSQSGCAYGCVFCATAKMGLNRNLKTWEIVDQVLAWGRLGYKNLSNLVFMGMGEPLANLKNVLAAVDVLSDTRGLGLSVKKMTISTVGLAAGIRQLADQPRALNLMVSLHAGNDVDRKKIMPRTAGLKELRESLLYYQKQSGRRVGIAYMVQSGINDRPEDIQDLKDFVAGLTFKINLLCENPISENTRGTSVEEVESFKDKLKGLGRGAISIRYPAGREDWAACGQLGVKL